MFDPDGKGKIEFKDFKRICKELGENMTEEQQHSMFDHADYGGKGFVSFDDFYKLMKKKDKSKDLDQLLGGDDAGRCQHLVLVAELVVVDAGVRGARRDCQGHGRDHAGDGS